jgi:hypothetical protein
MMMMMVMMAAATLIVSVKYVIEYRHARIFYILRLQNIIKGFFFLLGVFLSPAAILNVSYCYY